MPYCTRCGAALPHAPPVVCASCGEELWRNPKPAAAALIAKDGRLLLVKRAHSPWQGTWCAPSGFCEWDEHPAGTAQREALEETGLAIEITGYLGTWLAAYAEDDRLESAGPETSTIAVAYYHARPSEGGEGAFDRLEIAETAWFPADALPSELATPSVLPSVLAAWRAALAAGTTVTPLPDLRGVCSDVCGAGS